MPAKLTLLDDAVEVDLAGCRGSDFQDALAKVRDIPGRRFHTETAERADGTEYTRKVWLIPRDPKAAEKAVYSMQPDVDSDVLDWIREASVTADAELVTALPDDADDLLIPWAEHRAPWQPEQIRVGKEYEDFNGLKAHQRAWVSEVSKGEQVRVILADDMGLGKTFQIISAIAERAYRAGLGHYDDEGFDSSEPARDRLPALGTPRLGARDRALARPARVRPGHRRLDQGARAKQLQEVIERRGWAVVNYEQLRVVKERGQEPRRRHEDRHEHEGAAVREDAVVRRSSPTRCTARRTARRPRPRASTARQEGARQDHWSARPARR
jgi:hypothetical protein